MGRQNDFMHVVRLANDRAAGSHIRAQEEVREMTQTDAEAGQPGNQDAQDGVPPSLAVLFLLNAEAIAFHLPSAEPVAKDDANALRAALEKLPHDELEAVLGDVVTILVDTEPSLMPMLTDAKERAEVRGTDSAPTDTSTLLFYLLQNAWLIPVVVLSLRMLGEFDLKFGRNRLKMSSVLKDLAALIHKDK
ncbi:hypothetical protein PHAMO_250010 [Magnetospirillum molischianum DSM 120]|uniref:Uncharacterized protein n=2 Tax=Magnetospirillum molischianum TaxID=1083 RepID=H8FRZ2_MAGML|nr:hypothetical protein PHAMO_250010 [Magnetospirillum molischianum DSM 120]